MPSGYRTHKKNIILAFFSLLLVTIVFWLIPEHSDEPIVTNFPKKEVPNEKIVPQSIQFTQPTTISLPVKPEITITEKKTPPAITIEKSLIKRSIYATAEPGDTFYSIFKKLNISPKILIEMQKLPKASLPLKYLRSKQCMRFSMDEKNNLISFALALDSTHTIVISRPNLTSKFVAQVENVVLRAPTPLEKVASTNNNEKKIKVFPKAPPTYLGLHYTGLTIHKSLYGDGKKQGIPTSILFQLVKIFSLQINFRDIRPGDKLVIAYDDAYSKGKKTGPGNIIAAKFTRGKRVYTAIRYVNSQGIPEYVNENGEGMKKAFNRFPVKYTHINSLFNMHRIHPVTHVPRPHNGIDLAAPLGAPIYSIGDGKIKSIGWSGAYGNLITIQHNEKYSSRYAHLLRFAPGLHTGSYVQRGQLIGYLGQTGNATGPHIHFEIRIYDKPVNPLTAPLPYATGIPSSQAVAFRKKSTQLVLALDNYQKTYLK